MEFVYYFNIYDVDVMCNLTVMDWNVIFKSK